MERTSPRRPAGATRGRAFRAAALAIACGGWLAPGIAPGAAGEWPSAASAPPAQTLQSATRHEWRGAGDRFHRSNLPPEAFRADGRLRPAWDPNHPASQQAALLRRLAERERALQEGRSARADAEAEQAQAATASAGAPRAMPRHRLGLGELLDLEKNAGRPAGP